MATTALLTSAPRTAQTDTAVFTPATSRGILFLDVTADPGTASITPNAYLYDSVSGNSLVMWQAASAVTAVASYAYYFHNKNDFSVWGDIEQVLPAGDPPLGLPMFFRITVADAQSMTYSLSWIDEVTLAPGWNA